MDHGEKTLGKGGGAWCVARIWEIEILFGKTRGYFGYNIWVDEPRERLCWPALNGCLPLRRRRRKPSLPARYGIHLSLLSPWLVAYLITRNAFLFPFVGDTRVQLNGMTLSLSLSLAYTG